MRVTVATTIAEVESLRRLWEKLQLGASGSIFQTFEWNVLALRTFQDEKPHFVAAESQSSAAIVPAVIRGNQIRLAGGPLFDYREALSAGGDSALRLALKTIADTNLGWSIHGIRSAGGLHWSELPLQPWTAAPFVSRNDISAEAFAEKHSRARRSLRRLVDLGASVRTVPGTPDLVQHLYGEKSKEPAGCGQNVFQDPRCLDFMRNVVSLQGTKCDAFLMEIAENLIAALVTFRDREVRRFYTTWMNPRWSKHSPGIALLYHATCETLAAGLDCDYMTGEQPYKMRFATGTVPLYKLETGSSELRASLHREATAA